MGAGALQVLDGVVDHFLLRLHWLRPGGATLAWELGYQAASWALIAAGALVMRRAMLRREAATGSRRARRARPF